MSPNGTPITLSKSQEISQKRHHWACECVRSLTARISAGGEPPFSDPVQEQQMLKTHGAISPAPELRF